MGILPTLQAGSIGVIGGADGPTAIFVSSRIDLWVYVVGGAVLLAVALGGVALFMHHRSRTK